MKTRIMALGVLSLLAAPAARAAVYFDTLDASAVTAGQLNQGVDGAGEQATDVEASFALPAGFAIPTGGNVTVTMALTAQNDLQSYTVYLMPNAGGSGPGIAGAPGSSGVAVYTGLDSLLSADPTVPTSVSFAISATQIAAVTALTTNGEYWIDLVTNYTSDPTTSGSVEWFFNGDGSGNGTSGQSVTDVGGGLNGTFYALSGSSALGNAPEMIVQDPEPASIGIIGVGLAALGYVRRRRVTKLV